MLAVALTEWLLQSVVLMRDKPMQIEPVVELQPQSSESSGCAREKLKSSLMQPAVVGDLVLGNFARAAAAPTFQYLMQFVVAANLEVCS